MAPWLILATLLLPVEGQLSNNGNASQISAACRSQLTSYLLPLNDTTPCANELISMLTDVNSAGYSPIQSKCIGGSGLRTCFSIPEDVGTNIGGIALLDDVDDCELCSQRTQCQSLLASLAENVTAEPKECSSPMTNPSDIYTDLGILVFLRFQLDIKCAGVGIPGPVDGFMSNLAFLTQCQCGVTPCPPGILCEQDTPPVYCPEGYFCPDYGGTKHVCPEGSYCPEGSSEPIECSAAAACEEGAPRQYQFVPFLLLGLFIFGFYVFLAYWQYKKDQDTKKSIQNLEAVKDKATDRPDLDEEKSTNKRQIELVEMQSSAVRSDTAALEIDGRGQGGPRALKMTIGFDNLELKVPAKEKCLGCIGKDGAPGEVDEDGFITRLTGITGYLRAGTVTGVMGPSGSGKSTFLNVLCGKKNATDGIVYVNGEEADLQDFSKHIGFVPQDDIVDGPLLVQEALMFSASLRLNKVYAERKEIVDETLKVLGLWHVRESVIGDEYRRGVSGGEKKRVNIGLELVAEPAALFLDEPTTGLDATAALSVAEILQKLADKRGMMVCAVIHQPRPLIVDKMDKLILLVKGGRMAWFGTALGAVDHFEKIGFPRPKAVDFPDYLSDVVSGMASRTEGKSYETDAKKQKESVEIVAKKFANVKITLPRDDNVDEKALQDSKPTQASFCQQLGSYIVRGVWLRVVRTNRLSITAIAYFIGGLIIGIVFNHDVILSELPPREYGRSCPGTAGDLCFFPRTRFVGRWGFYNLICLGVIAVATGTATFGGSRKFIFWREASAGASAVAYFLGENLCDLLSIVYYGLVYSSAVQLIVPLRGPYSLYFCLWMLMALTVTGMAYIVSIGLRDLSNAMITGVVLSIVLSLFSGFVPRIGDNAYWTYTLWVGRACSNIEYIEGYNLNTTVPDYCREDPTLGAESNCFYDDGQGSELLSYFDKLVPETHRDPDLATDFGLIVFFAFLTRLIAFILLKTIDLDKQK